MNDFIRQNGWSILVAAAITTGSFFTIQGQTAVNSQDIKELELRVDALQKDGNRITILETNYTFVTQNLSDIKKSLDEIKNTLNVR
jgi:hypothetical protein